MGNVIGNLDLMLWVFPALMVAILVAIFAATAIWVVRRAARIKAETEFFEHRGVLGLAQVTGITENNMNVNQNSLVHLNLHIEGPGSRRSTPRNRWPPRL
jgi:hypothetical protein